MTVLRAKIVTIFGPDFARLFASILQQNFLILQISVCLF